MKSLGWYPIWRTRHRAMGTPCQIKAMPDVNRVTAKWKNRAARTSASAERVFTSTKPCPTSSKSDHDPHKYTCTKGTSCQRQTSGMTMGLWLAHASAGFGKRANTALCPVIGCPLLQLVKRAFPSDCRGMQSIAGPNHRGFHPDSDLRHLRTTDLAHPLSQEFQHRAPCTRQGN